MWLACGTSLGAKKEEALTNMAIEFHDCFWQTQQQLGLIPIMILQRYSGLYCRKLQAGARARSCYATCDTWGSTKVSVRPAGILEGEAGLCHLSHINS